MEQIESATRSPHFRLESRKPVSPRFVVEWMDKGLFQSRVSGVETDYQRVKFTRLVMWAAHNRVELRIRPL